MCKGISGLLGVCKVTSEPFITRSTTTIIIVIIIIIIIISVGGFAI